MKLSEALLLFRAAKQCVTSDANLRWYKPRLQSLLDHLGDVEVKTITTHDLRPWRNTLAERTTRWGNHPHRPETKGGLSATTIRGYVRACRALFNWLELEDILQKNPARRLEMPPKPKQPAKDISAENVIRILRVARNNLRDYAILRFLADTGCRVGGVATLTQSRLHLTPNGMGRYHAMVKEKGRGGEKKYRAVYFNQVTAQALADYVAERPPQAKTDNVFLSQRLGHLALQPLGRAGIYRMIGRYAKSLGINGKWNPHAWRHRFAHGLLDDSVPLSDVSQLMGHSGIQVTGDIYGVRADPQLANIHAAHSWLNDVDRGRAGDTASPVLPAPEEK